MTTIETAKNCLSLVIPTYNERENITNLLFKIETLKVENELEILIVDDNSPDGTADIVEKINKNFGNITIIRRDNKQGLSSAIFKGCEIAKSEIIGVLDADLQHPPEILPLMHKTIMQGYDIVVASRYIKGGGVKEWTLRRKIISKGAIILSHLIFKETRKLNDVMSGFFMFRKRILGRSIIDPIGYKILLEILVKNKNCKVREIPYVFIPRYKGKSKLSIKEILSYLQHLLKLYISKKILFPY